MDFTRILILRIPSLCHFSLGLQSNLGKKKLSYLIESVFSKDVICNVQQRRGLNGLCLEMKGMDGRFIFHWGIGLEEINSRAVASGTKVNLITSAIATLKANAHTETSKHFDMGVMERLLLYIRHLRLSCSICSLRSSACLSLLLL